jgi:hypothetical protein
VLLLDIDPLSVKQKPFKDLFRQALFKHHPDKAGFASTTAFQLLQRDISLNFKDKSQDYFEK